MGSRRLKGRCAVNKRMSSSSSQNRPYTRHYDVPFLDDLHNYFPAILYEHERFSTIQDLLRYIRTQMQQRFDLFTAGQRSYGRGGVEVAPPPPPAPPRPAQARTQPPPPVRRSRVNPNTTFQFPSIRATYNPLGGGSLFIPQYDTDPGGSIADIFSAFLQLGANSPARQAVGAAQAAWDDVPVRPTMEQIDAASVIENADDEEEMCTICQDRMQAGCNTRILRACNHRFHLGCIDTWFTRDVHCPVCRNDIREAQASMQTSSSTSTE